MFVEEVQELLGSWPARLHQSAPLVKIPLMIAVSEHDWLWEGSKQHLATWTELFEQSPKVDGALILGAPHALEWWKGSNAWFIKCFGWALEVVASQSIYWLCEKAN